MHDAHTADEHNIIITARERDRAKDREKDRDVYASGYKSQEADHSKNISCKQSTE